VPEKLTVVHMPPGPPMPGGDWVEAAAATVMFCSMVAFVFLCRTPGFAGLAVVP
jgi:hypothetical protein